MTYVSAEDLERELPFDEHDFPTLSSTEWDAAVERALNAASEMVDGWTATRYEPTDASTKTSRPEHVDWHDLPLPNRPIISVASVDVDGTALVEDDDYLVRETHLELLDDASIDEWPTNRNSVLVSWSFGYDPTPEPVREAVIRLARNALDQIETDGVASDSEFTYRAPADVKRECASMVKQFDAPSYFGGAGVM